MGRRQPAGSPRRPDGSCRLEIRHSTQRSRSATEEERDADRARRPTATVIDVVQDNASYNRPPVIKDYLAQDGCPIRLTYLPAYSPNLNMVERC